MGHLKLGSLIALLIIRLPFLQRPERPVTVLKGQREHFFFLSVSREASMFTTVGGTILMGFLGLFLESEVFLFLLHPPQAILYPFHYGYEFFRPIADLSVPLRIYHFICRCLIIISDECFSKIVKF